MVLVEVKDKGKINELRKFDPIVFASKYLNVVEIEALKDNLISHPNVVNVEESIDGEFI